MAHRGLQVTCALALTTAIAAAVPAVARADGTDDWNGSVTIYGWVPTMGGSLTVPLEGSVDAEMDPGSVLDALKFAFFVSGEVRKGRWGALTDVIYLDLGGTSKNARDLTVGDQELPAQLDTKIDLGLSGWVWTLGGSYALVDDPAYTASFIAGARLLDLTTELKVQVEGDIAGTPLPGRRSEGESELSNWDAIVGLKGRFDVGEKDYWFVPYYVDIGTGESDLTWQAVLGLGYSFGWGDLIGAWRYMDYDFGSNESVEDLWQSGIAVGATFHF